MNITTPGLLAAGVLSVSLCAGAASAAPAASSAPATPAADYAVVDLNTSVDQPIDVVWKKIGGYCDIAAWLKLPCVLTSGSGDVGTVRRLANRIDEVLVAKTKYSYTYTQPGTPIMYHGTLQVVPDGKNHTKILYNLIWDQAAQPDADAKAKDRAQRTTAFTNALKNMKEIAEAK